MLLTYQIIYQRNKYWAEHPDYRAQGHAETPHHCGVKFGGHQGQHDEGRGYSHFPYAVQAQGYGVI